MELIWAKYPHIPQTHNCRAHVLNTASEHPCYLKVWGNRHLYIKTRRRRIKIQIIGKIQNTQNMTSHKNWGLWVSLCGLSFKPSGTCSFSFCCRDNSERNIWEKLSKAGEAMSALQILDIREEETQITGRLGCTITNEKLAYLKSIWSSCEDNYWQLSVNICFLWHPYWGTGLCSGLFCLILEMTRILHGLCW